MQVPTVDWTRPPEIRWEKQLCPICSEPTGPESKCHKIDINAGFSESQESYGMPTGLLTRFNKTIELNGQIFPIFSKQCIFRRCANYHIDFNFPIGRCLANIIAAIEGVEQIFVESKYRMVMTIGSQFEISSVKKAVTLAYQKYIEENKLKFLPDDSSKKKT